MRQDDPKSPRSTRTLSRRTFLTTAGKAGVVVAGLNLLPPSIQKALAIPAARVRRTIQDVQHVVILMQENRSFDHYFGTMPGVRGFGDPTAIPLPSGNRRARFRRSRGSFRRRSGPNIRARRARCKARATRSKCFDILTSNCEVWSRTVLIVTFDENDGFFDHVPPPAVPSYNPDGSLAGKTTLRAPIDGEYYINDIDGVRATRPYGVGPRVPMYVVSPWSKGGWVCSETFDHTSTIRFLEARFGVAEPNITPWHRAVSGDLTRCFDFAHPDDGEFPELPDMSAATGETLALDGPPVTLPADPQLPKQASGLRYSRALPYVLNVGIRTRSDDVQLTFDNEGKGGAVFHVYDRLHLDRLPGRYTVEGKKSLADQWAAPDGTYDLFIVGPNGFLREYRGAAAEVETSQSTLPEVRLEYAPNRGALELFAWSTGATA